jgi:hypothetical protein
MTSDRLSEHRERYEEEEERKKIICDGDDGAASGGMQFDSGRCP